MIAHSIDGYDWYYVSLSGFGAVHSIVYGNGIYIAAGASSYAVSTDAVTWETYSLGKYLSVAYHNGFFYFTAPDEQMLYLSKDGVHFYKEIDLSSYTDFHPVPESVGDFIILYDYSFVGTVTYFLISLKYT